ncbi:neuronal acetylcholine receptor subunit alpha-10 precursor [Triplophysa rosa]|uniref:Neuronal acetylcholine receptor subunit alpha-10 n=1 Tax=Triplophysa rosa TaxID=992332 RepID=A0A9W7TPR8_TRIRA|nr:neuronal acetylcholine receptor subunit alpha-10 precursor [Triplophysa rosa]
MQIISSCTILLMMILNIVCAEKKSCNFTFTPAKITAVPGLCVLVSCTFACPDTTTSTETIMWKIILKNKTTEKDIETERFKMLEPDPNKNNCSFILEDIEADDAGEYTFRVRDAERNQIKTNTKVKIIIQDEPVIEVPPLREHEQANLSCSAPSPCPETPPHITWWITKREGKITEVKNDTTFTTSEVFYNSTLTFTPTSDLHNATVGCDVSYGNKINISTRRIIEVMHVKTLRILGNDTVKEGETLNLSCTPDSHPASSVPLWIFIGTTDKLQNISGENLSYTNVSKKHGGKYVCAVAYMNVLLTTSININIINSGEKVSLGVTVMLALTVFQLLVAEIMPPSENVPLIGKYYIATMTMINASTALTIFIMNIHHCGPEAKPVPNWAKKFILQYLARICFIYEVGENCMTAQPETSDHQPPKPPDSSHMNGCAGKDDVLFQFDRRQDTTPPRFPEDQSQMMSPCSLGKQPTCRYGAWREGAFVSMDYGGGAGEIGKVTGGGGDGDRDDGSKRPCMCEQQVLMRNIEYVANCYRDQRATAKRTGEWKKVAKEQFPGEKDEPVIEVPPLREHEQAKLSCSAPSPCPETPPHITWWITKREGKSEVFYNSTLTFTPTSDLHNATVGCDVSYGNKINISTRRIIEVMHVKTLRILGNDTVKEGETLNLSCTPDSHPASSVPLWIFIGTTDKLQNISGENLSYTNVSKKHGGKYVCAVAYMNVLLTTSININIINNSNETKNPDNPENQNMTGTDTKDTNVTSNIIIAFLDFMAHTTTHVFLMGMATSAIIFSVLLCCWVSCKRAKKPKVQTAPADSAVNLKMVQTNIDLTVTNEQTPLHNQSDAGMSNTPVESTGGEEESEAGGAEDGEAGKAAAGDVDYAAIDYSLLKKKSPEEGESKSMDTEYAEIKRDGKGRNALQNEHDHTEDQKQNEEEELYSNPDALKGQA